jgi:hypothetical protein
MDSTRSTFASSKAEARRNASSRRASRIFRPSRNWA